MEPILKPGDYVRITTPEGTFRGLVMKRPENADSAFITLKLDNGYNVGLRMEEIKKVEHLPLPYKKEKFSLPQFKINTSLPKVSILATGGTIASRVDYLTGGVHAAFSAQELISAVPEVGEIAHIKGGQLFNKFSENMEPEDWIIMARAAYEEIKNGADGVVFTHGTDTMAYSSAALSFMLSTPSPVVLTGAQRSSDRGSSDAALNLIWATTVAAHADFGGVCVVMHGESSDTFGLIHPGTRVRKLHSSRRDAFKTIGAKPWGKVMKGKIELDPSQPFKKRGENKLKLDLKLEKNVALVKYSPGLSPSILSHLVKTGIKGIVLEGTGLGHVSEKWFEEIGNVISSDIAIVMTTQTLYGRVNMNVYSTGRRLLEIGVIPGEDILPETAYVKLMWVLGHTKKLEEVRKMMLTNYTGEITCRSIVET